MNYEKTAELLVNIIHENDLESSSSEDGIQLKLEEIVESNGIATSTFNDQLYCLTNSDLDIDSAANVQLFVGIFTESYNNNLKEFEEYLKKFTEEITTYIDEISKKWTPTGDSVELRIYTINQTFEESLITNAYLQKNSSKKIKKKTILSPKKNILTTTVESKSLPLDPSKTHSFKINIDSRIEANKIDLDSNSLNGYVFTANLFDIARIFNIIGNELFDYNLRIGIDDKNDVDKSIHNTLKHAHKDFWYFNNGISLIIKKNHLDLNDPTHLVINYSSAKEFSIVNGAQTLTSTLNFLTQPKILKLLNKTNEIEAEHFERIQNETKVLLRVIEVAGEEFQNSNTISDKTSPVSNTNQEQLGTDNDVSVNNNETTISADSETLTNQTLDTGSNPNNATPSDNIETTTGADSEILTNQTSDDPRQSNSNGAVPSDNNEETSSLNKQLSRSSKVSKISIALNRQKPINDDDIAYVVRFIEVINNLKSSANKDQSDQSDITDISPFTFSIVRRGEGQNIRNNSYELMTFARIAKAYLATLPGPARSFSRASLLKIVSDEQTGDISFKDEGIFKDKEIYLIEEPSEYIGTFKKYYKPVNYAVQLKDAIDKLNIDKVIKNHQNTKTLKNINNHLINFSKEERMLFNESLISSLDQFSFEKPQELIFLQDNLRSTLNYGKYHLVAFMIHYLAGHKEFISTNSFEEWNFDKYIRNDSLEFFFFAFTISLRYASLQHHLEQDMESKINFSSPILDELFSTNAFKLSASNASILNTAYAFFKHLLTTYNEHNANS